MFVRLYEYNVSPTPETRNAYELRIEFGVVYINNQRCVDNVKTSKVVNLCKEKFATAVELAKEQNYSYKGGRQCRLTMCIDDNQIELCASGTNESVQTFYSEFRHEIEQILSE